MDQLDHVTTVIIIAVYKAIQKLITKIDFWYQVELLGFYFHVCLATKIHFGYYFLDNLTYCNYNYQDHVVYLIHSLKALNFIIQYYKIKYTSQITTE